MTITIPAHTLEDGDMRVRQLALGCATQSWRVGDHHAILGYADPEAYRTNPASLGVVVGRVANRISGAAFTLDGQVFHLPANEGPNLLHGGKDGLSRRMWTLDADGARRVMLRYSSPDGEAGFPGALDIAVTITLAAPTLTWDILATPDRPTPVNLAQHNYYALGGDCRDWTLRLPAGRHTPSDAANIPTGQVAAVPPEADFRTSRRIATRFDANFIPDETPWQAELTGRALALRMTADQPGAQLYTAHGLEPHARPLPGQIHAPFCAVCLEPQGWPDAVNRSSFPSIIATPERPYRQSLSVTITPV